MKYDYKALYEKNCRILEERPRLKKAVIWYNLVVPYLFIAAYLFLWVYGVFIAEFLPQAFLKIFFIPALALFVCSTLRLGIDRPRPFSEEGAGITPLRAKKGGKNSFPSRHLTCAAVIATVFPPYLSAVSGALFILTIGLGYTRFALGWHYPSDLLVGLGLGVAIGLAIFLL